MLYPQEMTEVELIVPNKDLVAVTNALSGLGAFHQVDGSYLSSRSVTGTPHPWQEQATAFSALDRRVQNLMQSLGLDEGLPPNTKFDEVVDLDKTTAAVERIEQETRRASERSMAGSSPERSPTRIRL